MKEESGEVSEPGGRRREGERRAVKKRGEPEAKSHARSGSKNEDKKSAQTLQNPYPEAPTS